ncbi:DUF4271 domain-containing protein [Brumimicrobium mesophilum]|uniref:DUF4271 domain-containing protein n=1 Tax=Brumimicrobium mesophilum TaxID=392717 RepID=UPI00131D0F2D|nr:DUF4271 domain-containing protein [Brumimicrobium mesophilum]
MELTLREELFPNWIVYVLLMTIVLLSVLKSQKELVFSNIKTTFVKPPSSLPEAKESLSFNSIINFLMLLNYFVVGGIAIYMLLVYYEKSDYWMVVLPAAIYLFQMLSLLLVIGLSGEFKKVRENILLLNFSTHILGIILIPILLIWLLNPHLSEYMVITLFSAFLLIYFIRLLRGMFLAIRNKVLWYYIILYLCGLEIWPIVVGYMLLRLDFIG